MAMSRDDQFISLGLGSTVLIYDLRTRTYPIPEVWTLGCSSGLESQKLYFTSDGRLISATRCTTGSITIEIYDFGGPGTRPRTMSPSRYIVSVSHAKARRS